MTQKNSFTARSFNRNLLIRNILVGAGVALIAILFFIVGVESQPDWPELWRIKPLLLTPLAGAFGGALAYFSNRILQQAGLNKILALIVSLVCYLIVLWLGIVLGLNGTMWD